MNGETKLRYFSLHLEDLPSGFRRRLLKSFAFSMGLTLGVLGVAVGLIWFLAG